MAPASEFWDGIARKYAARPIKNMPAYERTLERAQSYLAAGDHALEVGCGTGTTALKLAPHVRHITATDVSAEMIAIAREKAGRTANVTFRQAALPGE